MGRFNDKQDHSGTSESRRLHSSTEQGLVSVPIFHLARNDSTHGMGVFVEALIGVGDHAQYVTLLLDSGSSSMAVTGKLTTGKPGPVKLCDTQEFHNTYKRSHCALGSYDMANSTSVSLYPKPDSPYCGFIENVTVDNKSHEICVTQSWYADESGWE